MVKRVRKPEPTEDLWHLGIEDLLKPAGGTVSAEGPGPYVINLSTSSAPVPPAPTGMPRFEGMRLYQTKRIENGEPQFRLRLGVIRSSLEADAILAAVRDFYPAAVREIAAAEDEAEVEKVSLAVEAPPPAPKKVERAEAPTTNKESSLAAAPVAAQPPIENFRWDVDEILPDLKVTRPSRMPPAGVHAPLPQVASAPVPRAAPGPVPPAASAPVPPAAPAPVPPAASAPVPPAAPAPVPPAASAPVPPVASAPPPHGVSPVAPQEISRRAPVEPPRAAIVEEEFDSSAVTDQVPVLPFAMASPPFQDAPPHADDEPTDIRELSFDEAEIHIELDAPVPAPPALAPEPEVIAFAPPPEPEAEPATAVLESASASVDELEVDAAAPAEIQFPHAEIEVEARVMPEPVSFVVATTEPVRAGPPAAALSVAAPAIDDSGSLESVVAKIGALVESAEEHDETRTARISEHSRAIDSTQTLRALTPLELGADESAAWFCIQLSLTDGPVDPDHIPNLSIFDEYKLYAITGLSDDRVQHALRLGFFTSELAARAVAGYLEAYFDSPTITRVIMAEHDRFAEQRVCARKDVGESGEHSVIEIASAAPLREPPRNRVEVPQRVEAPQEEEPKAAAASASIWSRMLSPLRR